MHNENRIYFPTSYQLYFTNGEGIRTFPTTVGSGFLYGCCYNRLQLTARYITELLCDDSFNKYTSTICKTVSAAAITRIHIYAL